MKDPKKPSRKQQILEALAQMLESDPGGRITTANLAKQVGVTEAALYRHFPSKSKMFEGLILFIEEAIFSRVSVIMEENQTANARCYKILTLLLTFVERNPGISRLLTGDALAGETEKLRNRIAQFYDRLETQLKQILREAEIRENIRPILPTTTAANLLLASTEGRIIQFVRSEFKRSPTQNWHDQWAVLMEGFFIKTMAASN